MTTFEEITKLVAAPLSNTPGWAPLWLVMSLITNSKLPSQIAKETFGLQNFQFQETFLALILTLLFYQIGDLLDEYAFKKRVAMPSKPQYIKCHRFDPGFVSKERNAARAALGVEDGSYRVATALVTAAGQIDGVNIANEAAKFLRSLVVPFLLAAILGLGVTSLVGRAWLLVIAVIAFGAYFFLKLFHLSLLYRRAKEIPDDASFKREHLENGLILFFWNGNQVASADSNRRDLCLETAFKEM